MKEKKNEADATTRRRFMKRAATGMAATVR